MPLKTPHLPAPPQSKIRRAEWSYPRTVPDLFATQLHVAGLARGKTVTPEDAKAAFAHFGWVHAASVPRDQYRCGRGGRARNPQE